MDLLVHAHRTSQKFVDFFGIRPIAQRVFRFLLKARYGSDGLVKATQNGRTWLLMPEVALRGAYAEFETVEWLRKVVKPGDCVFDIGANVGQMTLEAAHLVGPTGKVVAVEPAPGNLQVLRMHINANGFADRVQIIEAACGSVNGGTITFHVFGESAEAIGSGHSTVQHDSSMTSFPISIPVVSIDALAESWIPKVVKIDVEGAELDVIQGAESTLRKYQPYVQIGFHPFAFENIASASLVLCESMERCGYAISNQQNRVLELAEYQFDPNSKVTSV